MDITGNYFAGPQRKAVYVVEAHHHVLHGWAEVSRSYGTPINLITLDHHRDGRDAFAQYLSIPDRSKFADEQRRLLKRIRYDNPESINEAVSSLKNDEHIRAALESGILNAAFAVTHFPHSDWPGSQHTDDRLFVILGECSQENTTEERERSARVIETDHLNEVLDTIKEMGNSIGIQDLLSDTFILDIDLDYFHTPDAIAPSDTSTFYRLLRQAVAITVALEPWHVQYNQIEGEGLNSEYLFERLRDHIEQAIGTMQRA